MWLQKKTTGILLAVLVLSGIGFFMHKATTKENIQHNTLNVAAGGTGYLTAPQPVSEKTNWSVGLYLEKDTEDTGVVVGVSVGYSF